jgi:hypothetical protein
MSTYSTIYGTVALDREAAKEFRARPSWIWFENSDLAAPSDDELVVELRGDMYRNLCRYLTTDLAYAQKYGNVYGTITIDCSDGDNWRCVTAFSGRGRITGTGDCFHEPVPARPGVIIELIALLGERPGLDVLVPTGTNDISLTGTTTSCECGCAGWEEDVPLCANRAGIVN